MAVRYQLSDKRGDAIILVTAESDNAQQAEEDFAVAVGLIGLAATYEGFTTGTGPAIATVAQVFPGAQVQQVPAPRPQQAAPQFPAAATPTCQHGTKVYKTGEKNGRAWKAWACPGASSDPTRCSFEWIRD